MFICRLKHISVNPAKGDLHMKKYLLILFIVVFMTGLTACGGGNVYAFEFWPAES